MHQKNGHESIAQWICDYFVWWLNSTIKINNLKTTDEINEAKKFFKDIIDTRESMYGRSAYLLACENGHCKIVELFLNLSQEFGICDISVTDKRSYHGSDLLKLKYPNWDKKTYYWFRQQEMGMKPSAQNEMSTLTPKSLSPELRLWVD